MSDAELSDHDKFQFWLMDMDDALERFMAGLPDAERERLDGTIASYDVIEEMLMARYPDRKAAKDSGDSVFFDGCARYVGETLRQHMGGKWQIVLDDPSNVHYRRPRLTGMKNGMPPVCPLQWLFTAVSRRKGNFMRTIVGNYA